MTTITVWVCWCHKHHVCCEQTGIPLAFGSPESPLGMKISTGMSWSGVRINAPQHLGFPRGFMWASCGLHVGFMCRPSGWWSIIPMAVKMPVSFTASFAHFVLHLGYPAKTPMCWSVDSPIKTGKKINQLGSMFPAFFLVKHLSVSLIVQ